MFSLALTWVRKQYFEEGSDGRIFEGIEGVGLYFSLGVEFVADDEYLGVGFVIVLGLGQPVVLEALG